MFEQQIEWIGEPITYRRAAGYGLVVGRYLHLFDATGRLESMQPITRMVLGKLLTGLYKDQALAMAANVRAIQEPSTEAEEMNNG